MVNYINDLQIFMLQSSRRIKKLINKSVEDYHLMLDELTENKLFKQHMSKWTGEATKTFNWEVYKFIHLNAVVNFKVFGTKIVQQKKLVL